ncbi:MAG: hypothetical protein WBL27_11700 [Salinimicrobium sp.]
MLKKLLLLLLISSCFACMEEQEKPAEAKKPVSIEEVDVDDLPEEEAIEFDREKWNILVDGEHPYRQKMLNHLIHSRMLKGLTREEVLDLLGKPTRTENDHWYYRISAEKFDFLLLKVKTLVLKFTEDGTVGPVLVHG